ncbi:MAG: alpha/beta hydrolase [Planctomycetes bacterium]|nr:alpha/beta hydrolase [Planctomycetota bacterium]MCW8134763.1 alpha/beta hydrolase [Planctomycetota bacterium]
MTVLYLPGLDGEGFCAEKIAQQAATRLEVFRYPEGLPLDWPSLTLSVTARMKQLGTRLLVGESFGGAVAQETLLRHSDALSSVFLLATFPVEPEPFAAALGRTATRFLPKAMLKPVARQLAAWKLAGTMEGHDREKFLARFAEVDHAELARRLELLKGFDTRRRLMDVKLPIEFAYGTRDRMCNQPDLLKVWANVPGCRVHAIAGYGHLVSAEAAPEVARLIDDWAARHAATDRLDC